MKVGISNYGLTGTDEISEDRLNISIVQPKGKHYRCTMSNLGNASDKYQYEPDRMDAYKHTIFDKGIGLDANMLRFRIIGTGEGCAARVATQELSGFEVVQLVARNNTTENIADIPLVSEVKGWRQNGVTSYVITCTDVNDFAFTQAEAAYVIPLIRATLIDRLRLRRRLGIESAFDDLLQKIQEG